MELPDEVKQFYVDVAKRSIRNCYWSSKLWINFAIILEKFQYPSEKIKGNFQD